MEVSFGEDDERFGDDSELKRTISKQHCKSIISITSTLPGQVLSDTTGVVAGVHVLPLPVTTVELPLSLAESRLRALMDLVNKTKLREQRSHRCRV